MIDDNKIKEIAKQHAEGAFISETWQACYKEGFMDCARWMQEEFLKKLWHPASEEPIKDVSIIVETHNDKNMFYYVWNRWQDNFYPSWTDAILCSRVSRWLYIDDLLPKEGGEQ
jgi:hypothetical protein